MKKIIFTSFLLGLILLNACVKNDKIAPDLQQLTGPVVFTKPINASTLNPNFSVGDKVYFSAEFANDANWVITITGNTSGAVKTFEGAGKSITPTLATWDGTANDVPSFRAEAVTVTIAFPKASSVSGSALTFPITIQGTKNLNYGHVLITDFNYPLPPATPKIYDVWNGDFTAVDANQFESNFTPTVQRDDAPFINPDGNYFIANGPQAPWQDNEDFPGHISPYIDHLKITAYATGYGSYFPLIADPNQIFFNIMMYNTSASNYTWLQVTLNEDHPSIPGQTISKSYNIYPTWTNGWKVVTIKYTDFKIGTGTTILNNPQKIKSVQLTLLSSAPQDVLDAKQGPVAAYYDHLIFTHYKPYQP